MPEEWRQEVSERFGANLRRTRRREDVSQERLARRAGLHHSEVGKIERGLRLPRVDTLIRLADGLGVEPVELLVGIHWVPGPARGGTFLLDGRPLPARRADGDDR